MADQASLREVNRDVWHAFRDAYAARDLPAFLALNDPDLIRASGQDKTVRTFDSYATVMGEFFNVATERGDTFSIDFRFVERLVTGDLASERGVFQISAAPAGRPARTFYGRFHTYCRRTDGRWRIVMDYDSSEGGTVSAEDYAAGVPIDDVEAFET